MSGKRKFEEQLAVLDALRQQPSEATIEPLRKALSNRNNFIVAKAAEIVRELQLTQLTPELLQAFDHFFDDPIKSDPQCWAKNAISKALAAFEYQEPEIFLRGMKHIQLEPTRGGSSDSAGTLRATCAFALVQCRGVREPELLQHLVDLMGDEEKSVRAEAVRAIEQVGSPSAALLLRLKAIAAADEPEVLGACYSGVLGIEGPKSIPWVARFLARGDDAAAEAALAIAGTHAPEGFEVLRKCFAEPADLWFSSVLLSAMALTRQEEAIEFLMDEVRRDSLHAESAIEAIMRSLPSKEIEKRLEKIVAGNPQLARAFAGQRRKDSAASKS